MQTRDCQGYGVYEAAGDAAATFQSTVPSPTPLARLALVAAPAPAALTTRAPVPLMRLSFAPQPVAARNVSTPGPSGRGTAIARTPRVGFQIAAQPVRRRVQVPLPIPRTASPVARGVAAQMPPTLVGTLPYRPGTMTTADGQTFHPIPIPPTVTTDVLPGLPVVPGMPALGFTQHGNLWIVDPAQSALLATLLGTMSFEPYGVAIVGGVTAGAGDLASGASAAFVVAIPPGTDAWSLIQLHAQQGYATLVEKASVATGTLNLIQTPSPQTIAFLAGGPASPCALLDSEPSALIDQADQSLNPAPAETTCPPGTFGTPPNCVSGEATLPTCVPNPGNNFCGSQPASMTTPAPSGSWWGNLSTTEKVVGVGALALVGLAVASQIRREKA